MSYLIVLRGGHLLSVAFILLLGGCGWMFKWAPDCIKPDASCSLNPVAPAIHVRPISSEEARANPVCLSDEAALHGSSTSNKSSHHPQERMAVLLIHGIYGSADTFGCLPYFLARDYPDFDVYIAEYWSNSVLPNFQRLQDLGEALLFRLRSLAQSRNMVIITHSMGGLIAREAVSLEGERIRRNPAPTTPTFLNRTMLIQIGTPNRGSAFAHYGSYVKSVLFYPFHIMINWSGPPYTIMYDRQLFDMPLDISDDMIGETTSPFIQNLNERWLEVFGPKEISEPDIHLFMGFNSKEPTDGIVTALNQRSVNAPAINQHCIMGQDIPTRHWNGIANVNNRNHEIYKLLQGLFENPHFSKWPCPDIGSTNVLLRKLSDVTDYRVDLLPGILDLIEMALVKLPSTANILAFPNLMHEARTFPFTVEKETVEFERYHQIARFNMNKGEEAELRIMRRGESFFSLPHEYNVIFLPGEDKTNCSVVIRPNALAGFKEIKNEISLFQRTVNYFLLEPESSDDIRISRLGCQPSTP